MNVCEELVKKLNENGSYAETLREKILYCIGYLESVDENDDLYNLLTYMLYTEKVYPDEPLVPKYFIPNIDFSKMNDFFTNNSRPDISFNDFIKENFKESSLCKK